MGADNKPAEEEIRRPEEARVVIVNSDSDSDVSDDDQIPAGYERIPSDPDEDEEEVEVVFEDEKVEKEGDDKKEDEVDIEQVKNAMAGMILPPSSVPKWGAMLSDSDFINAVRETIKPKLDHAQQQKTKKPAESKKTQQKLIFSSASPFYSSHYILHFTNCGSAVIEACEGSTFELTAQTCHYSDGTAYTCNIEQASNKLVSEIISIATFMITVALSSGTQGMSPNVVKGINALRCAILNGFIQTYLMVAAIYYAARQFGQEGQIQDYINQAAPHICTCQADVQEFGKYFGGGDQSDFETCV